MSARRLLGSSLTLALVAGMLVVSATQAGAFNITVNSLTDDGSGGCTLREAITNANADNQSGSTECAAGSGADVITFSVTGAIYLASELPSVTSTLAIQGPGGAFTISGDTNNDNNVTANVRIITVLAGASLDLSGVTIAEGKAAFGGGIRNAGTLTVTSSTFTNNDADHGAGIDNDTNGSLTVTNSTFYLNVANFDGGGIFNNGGTLTVTSSLFTSNSAGLLGGGIWNLGTADVTSSTFSGNSTGNGGGIWSNGTLTITNSTFSGNPAASDGGGIFNDDSSTVTITNSTLSSNTAGGSGGGVYNYQGGLTVTGSTLSNNGASSSGGGIHNNDGAFTITNSTLSGNCAGTLSCSGPVSASVGDDGALVVGGSGGGIFNYAGPLNTITNTTLTGNTATIQGGGIYNTGGGNLDTIHSTLSGNSAPGGGGGMYNDGGTLAVTGSTFSGNDATFGGGINSNGGTLTVTNSTFSGNTAAGGGGIYNVFGNATVTSSTFSSNNASAGGGGGIQNGGTLTVTNSTFSGNTASSEGGGIYNVLGNATVTNSTFSGNSASSGGGIHHAGGGSSTTLRSTIVANSSGGDCISFPNPIVDGGYNLSSDATCGFSGTSLASTNPLLGSLADNGGPTRTHAIGDSSPAINRIPVGANGCGTDIDTDQRGFVRPDEVGSECDIGAYESVDPAVVPPPGVGPTGPTLGVVRLGTGAGSVTSSPPGINCPPDCSEQALSAQVQAIVGTTFVLSAHPASGSVFVGWSGPCTGSGTCTITLNTNLTVSATFDLAPPPPPVTFGLNVFKVGKGKVLSAPAAISCGQTCSGTFQRGTTVTLTANPRQGWHLKRWRFGCKGQGSVCTLEMSSDRRAKAMFVKD